VLVKQIKKKRYLASYSSVDNSICRHILIAEEYACVGTLIALVLLRLFVYFQ